MPYVNLYVAPKAKGFIEIHSVVLGMELAQATAQAFPGLTPENVSVRVFPFTSGYNASALTIEGEASYSEERAAYLQAWKILLTTAWLRFSEKFDHPWLRNVEVFVKMPVASWMPATLQALEAASLRLLPTSQKLAGLDGNWVRLSDLANFLKIGVDQLWCTYCAQRTQGNRFVVVAYELKPHAALMLAVDFNGNLPTGGEALGSSQVFSAALPYLFLPEAAAEKIFQQI